MPQSEINARTRAPFAGIVILIVVLGGLVLDTTRAGEDNFYADYIRLDQFVAKVNQNYVEEVSSKALVDNAIDGMLKILDPHTTYFEPKEFNELMIHTEGKFGGLGIQISVRENVLTVMTPISGTPAARTGILSGDQIIKINNESTAGITVDAAVAKLRGEPGTNVTITIRRKGEKDTDYTITREIIHIKAVPFYGMLTPAIGYVRLNTFSEEATSETQKAVNELLAKGCKGIVYDLRSNPGGLLPQAIDVSEIFLPKGSLVVSTRGRIPGQNREYSGEGSPIVPASMPVVVLVNQASASASEIVSGAIQDWDRGVVMGDTTFGKGSVQSILPVDKTHHLKITTAFYYTPSGRCINKPENGIRGASVSQADSASTAESDEGVDDTTRQAAHKDPAAVKDSVKAREEYKTKSGRIVYGGGGIIPDTIVTPEFVKPLTQSLLRKGSFFNFGRDYAGALKKKKNKIDQNLVIDEPILKDFYHYLDSSGFEYKTPLQSSFDEFKNKAGLTVDTTKKDSVASGKKPEKPEWSATQLKTLEEIGKKMMVVLNEERKQEFEQNKDDIKWFLKDALLSQIYGQDNDIVYRSSLEKDTQVKAAMGLLQNNVAYEALLKPRKK